MEKEPTSEASTALTPAKPASRDRREHSRYGVYASAIIHLIKMGADFEGRVLDLSLSGCRIRTTERMTVGINRQVEVEFRLEGLPFRLGGVLQAIHDRQTVGIHFIDMSSRKREGLVQLIRDIEEMRARAFQETAAGGASSSTPGAVTSEP